MGRDPPKVGNDVISKLLSNLSSQARYENQRAHAVAINFASCIEVYPTFEALDLH